VAYFIIGRIDECELPQVQQTDAAVAGVLTSENETGL
jgi:hypothetical protein